MNKQYSNKIIILKRNVITIFDASFKGHYVYTVKTVLKSL